MGLVSVISTRRRPGLWAWCLLIQRVDVQVYGSGVCYFNVDVDVQRVVQVYGSGVCYFNA